MRRWAWRSINNDSQVGLKTLGNSQGVAEFSLLLNDNEAANLGMRHLAKPYDCDGVSFVILHGRRPGPLGKQYGKYLRHMD